MHGPLSLRLNDVGTRCLQNTEDACNSLPPSVMHDSGKPSHSAQGAPVLLRSQQDRLQTARAAEEEDLHHQPLLRAQVPGQPP